MKSVSYDLMMSADSGSSSQNTGTWGLIYPLQLFSQEFSYRIIILINHQFIGQASQSQLVYYLFIFYVNDVSSITLSSVVTES